MPLKEGFGLLDRMRESLQELATERGRSVIADAMRAKALELAKKGFDSQRSPTGTPWVRGASGFGGALHLSGRLRQGLRAEERPNGFALVIRAQAPSGALYAGTHQYGRTIKARGKPGFPGSKPMRWKRPDGGWASAWKARIPARPMLPRNRLVPEAWARELEAVSVKELGARFAKTGGRRPGE